MKNTVCKIYGESREGQGLSIDFDTKLTEAEARQKFWEYIDRKGWAMYDYKIKSFTDFSKLY